jgi:hypothetical protein
MVLRYWLLSDAAGGAIPQAIRDVFSPKEGMTPSEVGISLLNLKRQRQRGISDKKMNALWGDETLLTGITNTEVYYCIRIKKQVQSSSIFTLFMPLRLNGGFFYFFRLMV